MSEHAEPSGGPLAEAAAALIDRRGVVSGWSPAAEELLKLGASQVVGRSVVRLLADPPSADGGTLPEGGQVDLLDGSGRRVPVCYRTARLDGTGQTLVLALAAERASESDRAEALTRALLAQDRIGLVFRDTDLQVVQTNVGHRIFPGPPLPAGSRLSEVMSPPDAASTEADLRHVLKTGESFAAHEHRVRALQPPDGEWALSVSAVRTEDTRGRPTGVAVLLTDATEHWHARRRAELRHRAAASIGGTLDIGRTAQEIVDALVPDFADLAWVDLADAVLRGDEPPKTFGGGDLHLRRAALRSGQGPWPPDLVQMDEVIPPLPDLPLVRALQEGCTVVVDRDTLVRDAGDSPHIHQAVPEGGHSLAVAPLFARGLVLGVVAVWRTAQPEPFDEGDAAVLAQVAAHSALGVDNARRYAREHRAAVALQRRLLPQASTSTPAMETAGLYEPAAGGAEIGGDWFDAIELPSLRTALVVGDVVGHGLHAAATMGRLRTAVQTLADLELSPDELLTHLDGLVARLADEADPAQRDMVGATCLVAVHDPVSARCTMAAAGHPQPLLAVQDGGVEQVAVPPGPPLGVGGLPFETTTVDMPPGSVLALYTDGLLQRYGADVDRFAGDLAERLGQFGRSGRDLPSLAQSLMRASDGRSFRDDAALLLASPSALAEDAVASWEFPAEPAAVASAREAATSKLADWGLDANSFVTELVVSELVTNAVRYAGGPVGLRLIRDDALFCEVTDPSNTQPRMRRARSTDEGGRGLFLVAQLSRRWGSRYGPSGKTIWVEQELSA